VSLLDDIIRGEIEFPRDFSNLEFRPWGLLYHNVEIADSWDSNHARILHAEGEALPGAVTEVVDFYRGQGLIPRVYHLSRPGEGRALRAALERAGFTFSTHNDTFFVHRRPSAIVPRRDVEVRRVTSLSAELAEMIERSHDGNPRARKVVQRRIGLPNIHFHVVFAAGRPVATASLHDMGCVTLLDDVLTDISCRGRGYCRAVIHHLVQYHAANLSNPLELYAENPTAIRIYEQAGFVPLDGPLECWSAWLDRHPEPNVAAPCVCRES